MSNISLAEWCASTSYSDMDFTEFWNCTQLLDKILGILAIVCLLLMIIWEMSVVLSGTLEPHAGYAQIREGGMGSRQKLGVKERFTTLRYEGVHESDDPFAPSGLNAEHLPACVQVVATAKELTMRLSSDMAHIISDDQAQLALYEEPTILAVLRKLNRIRKEKTNQMDKKIQDRFKMIKLEAKMIYYRLWFILWMAKLKRWNYAKSSMKSHKESIMTSADNARRMWFYRVLPFLVFSGLFLLFWLYLIPDQFFQFKQGGILSLLVFVVSPIEYFLLICSFLFTSWPARAPKPQQLIGQKDKFALLVASWRSQPEGIARVIDAALERMEGSCVFICENEENLRPKFTTTREICRQKGVNYVFCPEGNKPHVFDWVTRHYLPDSTEFVMMTDDDVELPPNIEVPFNGVLADENVAALAYVIRANPDSETGQRNALMNFQDLEYKLAGLVKVFQNQCGSVLCAHGAISLWKRKPFLKIMWMHNTVFDGEDLQMGMILNADMYNTNLRMEVVASEAVPTNPPQDIFYWPWEKTPDGMKPLWRQRIMSWDACAQRFLFKFIAFFIGGLIPPKHRIVLHLYNVANIWTIFQDYVRPFILLYYAVAFPSELVYGVYRVFCLEWSFLILFNYIKLGHRSDLRSPWYALLLYPFYQVLCLGFRMGALWYNFFFYHSPKLYLDPIRVREDMHDRPPFLMGLDEFGDRWEDIWDISKIPDVYKFFTSPQAGKDSSRSNGTMAFSKSEEGPVHAASYGGQAAVTAIPMRNVVEING